MAALALAKRSINIDNMFFMWGTGGVGLSLTTAHLDAMLGDKNHRFFDPQMFDMEEEMRKQVELLTGALVLTAQDLMAGGGDVGAYPEKDSFWWKCLLSKFESSLRLLRLVLIFKAIEMLPDICFQNGLLFVSVAS